MGLFARDRRTATHWTSLVDAPERAPIGRGRSGIVYRELRPGEPARAVKVFVGDPLGDLVHLVLTGAPNPYRWNGDAVAAALHRRRVVGALVRLWFGDRLRVAPPRAVRWNQEARAWELHADLVRGRPASLHHPFSAPRDEEQTELLHEIMRPLQRRLRRAGLYGLAWQAGLGNPVATDNFLRDGREPGRWHWIDLESGVPAVAPGPLSALTFYLPRTLALGRPLFDDVDVERLRGYVEQRHVRLRRLLGEADWRRLCLDIAALGRHQRAWRAQGRLERGLTAAVALGKLSLDEALRYRGRPLRWIAREARLAGDATRRAVRRGLTELRRRLTGLRPLRLARAALHFTLSARRRRRVGRRWVLERIRYWRRRGQLDGQEAAYLRRQSRGEEDGTYLTDFAVHLALKPVYKPLAWLLVPALVQLGWLGPVWLPLALLLGGACARTVYTTTRLVDALLRRRRPPWFALAWGALPVVGTAAFPLQILVRGAGSDRAALAGLLVYDVTTALGRRIPIWGGPDTLTEHRANRIADLVIRDRSPLMSPVATAGTAARPGRRPA